MVLVSLGHSAFGLASLSLPLAATAAAAMCVQAQRCRRSSGRTKTMSCLKFSLLSVKCLAAHCQGFFCAAPQLVLQTAVATHGIFLPDLEVLFSGEEGPSSSWFRGGLHMVSLLLSLASLTATLVHYNRETLNRNTACRYFASVASALFSVLLRVFLLAVLVTTSPLATAIVCVVVYSATAVVYRIFEFELDVLLLSGYSCIFSPSGHTRLVLHFILFKKTSIC